MNFSQLHNQFKLMATENKGSSQIITLYSIEAIGRARLPY